MPDFALCAIRSPISCAQAGRSRGTEFIKFLLTEWMGAFITYEALAATIDRRATSAIAPGPFLTLHERNIRSWRALAAACSAAPDSAAGTPTSHHAPASVHADG